MEQSNCVFCKVGKGEIPHNRLNENEKFVSFLDIKPVSKGHALVIPKKHIVWMQEADDEVIGEIFKYSKKIMLGLKKGMGCDYVQVSVVGKDVPHFHIHLIPRFYNDELEHKLHLDSREYINGEDKEVLNKIISALNF